MIIKVLGAGCSSCTKLENNTKEALKQLNLGNQVIKVSDIQDILVYDVMSFPALVIDEKVILSGRNPTIDEIKKLIVEHSKQ